MLRCGKIINAPDTDEETESEQYENIEVINNDIYFYSDITTKSALHLITIIKKLEIELLTLQIKFNFEKININLHINSQGGELDAAISIVDTILKSRVDIISIIEGIACSAATLISVVCKKRIICKNASMMIHQLSSGFWGKMNELEDEYKNLLSSMKTITNIYNIHTKIDSEKLSKVLKKDINWSATKCLKYGLVDSIL